MVFRVRVDAGESESCPIRPALTPCFRRECLKPNATFRLTGVPTGLQRKIRKAGHSVVVTLPSQLAELADLGEGDIVEFEYLGRGALRIAKKTED